MKKTIGVAHALYWAKNCPSPNFSDEMSQKTSLCITYGYFESKYLDIWNQKCYLDGNFRLKMVICNWNTRFPAENLVFCQWIVHILWKLFENIQF